MGSCLEKSRLSSSVKDLKSPGFYIALLAEFVGAFLFLFIGVSSIVVNKNNNVGIGFAFGFGIACVAWLTAGVSGGHINPAVSLSMLVARRVSLVKCLLYSVAQCCGAILGVKILQLINPDISKTWGVTDLGIGVTDVGGFFYEVVISFSLIITVYASCDGQRSDLHGSRPLAIGIAVFIAHLGAIQYTGSSMNPARSIGSAVIAGHWENHWVYWAGPCVGGIIATFLYEFLFAANACRKRARNWAIHQSYNPDLREAEYDDPSEVHEMLDMKA